MRQPQVRLGEKGRAHQLLHGRRQGAHPGQLRPAPRDHSPLLRPQGLHPHQPARRHAARRRAHLGVRRRRRARLGEPAHVGPQADHRQQHSRVHAARLRHRPQGHRPRRPAAPHAGQRLPRRILRRLRPPRRVRHYQRAVSKKSSTSSTSRSSASSAKPSSSPTWKS